MDEMFLEDEETGLLVESGRILITNSNLGQAMPTLTLDLCRMTGKQQADCGGYVMARGEGLSRSISSCSTVGRPSATVALMLRSAMSGSELGDATVKIARIRSGKRDGKIVRIVLCRG